METFSALLAICAGNSPVTGEFPSQGPVTRSFHVFFDMRLEDGKVNNREAGDLTRHRAHYDVTVMVIRFLGVAHADGTLKTKCIRILMLMILFIWGTYGCATKIPDSKDTLRNFYQGYSVYPTKAAWSIVVELMNTWKCRRRNWMSPFLKPAHFLVVQWIQWMILFHLLHRHRLP